MGLEPIAFCNGRTCQPMIAALKTRGSAAASAATRKRQDKYVEEWCVWPGGAKLRCSAPAPVEVGAVGGRVVRLDEQRRTLLCPFGQQFVVQRVGDALPGG